MKRIIVILLYLSLLTPGALSLGHFSSSSEQELFFSSPLKHKVETFDCYTDVRLFTSPDSSYQVLMDFFNDTESELLIATYQFNCQHISERVSALASENINVTVIVDGQPVGDISTSTLSSLNRIKSAGGSINAIEWEDNTFFHGKYMIRDRSHVLITSENFGRNGFSREPTWGNRGWGMIVNSTSLADYYRDIYLHDLNLSSAISPDVLLTPYEPVTGYYKPRFQSEELHDLFRFTPVTAPETSYKLIDMIQSAKYTIHVQQYYIRNWGQYPNPLVEALKEAAGRGVEVKIQMDSTYFHIDDNKDMVNQLNQYAEKRDLELEARLMEYRQGFQSVHNKGMIVDGSKVLISSINWNENSYSNNREIALIVENRDVGQYFSNIFLTDWKMLRNRPIADAGEDIEDAVVNEVITLDGSYSWDLKNISRYRWDLTGNGVYEKEGPTVNWTFYQAGTYEVTLKVIDLEGESDTDTVNIYVSEPENVSDEKRTMSSMILLSLLLIFFVWLSKLVADP
ncbi:MAG: phospholipase D-like domain-containing protein [Thermoplasmata archaeon]